MSLPRWMAAIATVATLALHASVPVASQAAGPSATVTTYAGTGISGNHDGPLASATFASPAGLAVGPHGEIYVIDKALNTLRVIENGTIATLAGNDDGDPVWRPGGYRDGPLATARFNHPEGITVAPDGSILIADTLNLAVRRIKDGVVSTVAGGPQKYGMKDGPVASALFKFPVSVAVDPKGNVYVADQQNAVREISAAGVVSTLAIADDANPSSVAYSPVPNPALYIADVNGLVRYDLERGTSLRIPVERAMNVAPYTEGVVPIGRPYAIAVDAPDDLTYTDANDNSVRRLSRHFLRGLAGGDPFDPNRSGGFADGPGETARFNAPLAIVNVEGGWLVADAGNHRLRRVSNVDERTAVTIGGAGIEQYYTGRRPAIAIVGNSQVWTDSDYAESVAGTLAALIPGYDVVPVTLPGIDDPEAIADYCTTFLLPLARLEAIVYVFNDAGVTEHTQMSYDALVADESWAKPLLARFQAARSKLSAAHAQVVVLDMPVSFEASPNELTFGQQTLLTKATLKYPKIDAVHAKIQATLAASGFAVADAWPAFRAADRDGQGPLFGPFDPHLSSKGRALLAHAIAAALAARHIPPP